MPRSRQTLALAQGTEPPDEIPALAQGTEPPDEFPAPTRGNESPDEILAHARGNRVEREASVKTLSLPCGFAPWTGLNRS